MEQWLIFEFVKASEPNAKGTIELVTTKELLTVLEKEGRLEPQEQRLLAVYEIGKCVLDWS